MPDVAQSPFCELHLDAELPGRTVDEGRGGETTTEDSDANDPRPL